MDRRHFIAGTAAGIGGVIVGHPFDTIRVKMQTQPMYNMYSSPLDCAIKVLKSQGPIKGLYRGATGPMLGSVLFRTVNFGIYGNIVDKLNAVSQTSHLVNSMIAGTVSSQLCGIILVPIDRTKIILQTHTKFTSPLHVLRSMPAKEIFVFGTGATLAREALFGITYFPLFQATKRLSREYIDIPFLAPALSGGFTGSLTWSIVYPLDVVKSKIQSNIDGNPAGYFKTVRKHYKNEGIKGFYKGWRAAVYRAFPTHATVLALYQVVLSTLPV
jgi:solute carrier family 25 carnitine/acylcarnitine transporter 20/29